MGSHGTRLTLRAGPAAAARRTWIAAVTLGSWEAGMSCLPLEARGSHESGGSSGAGVSPQARLSILSIQTVQAGRALDPGRSWWPRGTRHA